MAHSKSIPLTLKGTGADLRSLTAAEEESLSIFAEKYIVDNHPASNFGTVDDDARNYHGSIDRYATRVADSDMIQIGSYTDTFYNQAVGTHPGTSLNSSTVTTPLFQCYDSSARDSLSHIDYPTQSGSLASRLVAVDSDGDIREMDSDYTIMFGKRLLQYSLSTESVGSFRIGTTNPSAMQGGSWEVWNNSAFSDTTASTSTPYNIYRKTDGTTAEQSAYNAAKLNMLVLPSDDDASYQTHDIKENKTANLELSMAQACRHARVFSDLGKMVLLPSTQTPASTGETGTWQPRGTISDTINVLESIQYASTFFLSYSNEQFTGQYTGQYTGFSSADVPVQYAGQRLLSFAGSRTNYQNGAPTQFVSTRTYSGQYGGSRTYTAQYVGTRNFSGARAFVNIQYQQFAGSRQYLGYFAGTRNNPRYNNFTGYYNFVGPSQSNSNFAGNRWVNVPGLGNYFNQFLSLASGSFGGQQLFAGSRSSTTFGGGGKGSGWGGGVPRYFTKFAQFTGTRQFSGSRLVSYSGSRYFTGQRNVNYAGNRQFSGTRYYTAYQSFGGQRAYGNQYAGQRLISERYVAPANFAGTRTPAQGGSNGQFGGSRTFSSQYAGSRNNAGAFTGQRTFSGTYTRNSTIQRPSTVPTNYSAQYSGTYAGQYTREYVGQNSQQYAGDTLTAVATVLETYTLYCKVSES
tara:strand:- start:2845 stop:4902 length:2058 start_codon:yes stop_codon:yes gene_type:complete